MGLCRGNLGNLMQHWVLSEILAALGEQPGGRNRLLLFGTTHSMAPWSVPRQRNPGQDYSRPRFDRARTRLGRAGASAYEQAWAALSCRGGLPYPSSAVFALHLWEGLLSFVLCEDSKTVANEIAGWLALPEVRNRLASDAATELHRGDWRGRFAVPFGDPPGVKVVYVEMDPMRFEHHGRQQGGGDNAATLYAEDLPTITAAFAATHVPVALQVSSFSANNINPHQVVEASLSAGLGQAGFQLQGRVEADGNMISLVYSRGLALWQAPELLDRRFAEWAQSV
jgi:hypothetical protein